MAIKPVNCTSVTIAVTLLILVMTLYQSGDTIVRSVNDRIPAAGLCHPDKSAPIQVNDNSHRPSFLDIAQKFGTDKVTTHRYNYMYEKYLEPIRDRKLKMLEIGLGCNMGYGPGASYHTWLEFLPNVDLYYIEFDEACVKKWEEKTTGATIYTGGQGNPKFLQEIIHKSGGNFDIIIDDGGYTMHQQMISLETLFPAVVPKGIYFCEDLATSYEEVYGGGPGKATMYGMIKDLLDDLNHDVSDRPAPKYAVDGAMRSIECGEQICAFLKE